MSALFLGRFQPPHRGHLHAIRVASRRHGDVWVGVGSAQYSHAPENPLTVGERFELLGAALREAGLARAHLFPIPDLHRYAKWVDHVESLVPPFDVVITNNPVTRRLFGDRGHRVEVAVTWRPTVCSGTSIRARWARGDDARDLLPRAVWQGVRRFGILDRVRTIREPAGGSRGRAARP